MHRFIRRELSHKLIQYHQPINLRRYMIRNRNELYGNYRLFSVVESPIKRAIRENDEWREVRNQQGRIYYLNSKSGERTWDKPENVKILTLAEVAWRDVERERIEEEERVKAQIESSYAGDSTVWKFAEKSYDALVRSQTLYWVAFIGAVGYLGYVFM